MRVLAPTLKVKWRLMVTSCYRRMGNYQKALELYEKIHSDYPDNLECKYMSSCLVCFRIPTHGQVVRLVQTEHFRICLALILSAIGVLCQRTIVCRNHHDLMESYGLSNQQKSCLQ